MALPGLLPMDEEEERRRREAEAMGMATPTFDDTMMQGPKGMDPGAGAAAEPIASQPAVQPLVLAQPADVSKTVRSGVQASPQSRRAIAEHEAAGTALVDATTREADAKREQAQTANQAGYDTAAKEAEHAKGREAFQRQHLEWLKKVDEHADRDVKYQSEQVERAYQEKQKDYWSDKPWWAKVLAAVAVAASRRNLRIMGDDPNKSGVQAAIDEAVDKSAKAKQAAFLRSEEFLKLAKSRPAEARQLYDKRLKDFEAQQAAELGLVAKEAAKLKASKALDPALVDAQRDAIVATQQEKFAEAKQKLRQHYEPTVSRTDVDSSGQQAGPGAMHPDAVLDAEGNFKGLAPPGTGEGKASRAQQAALKPVLQGIARIAGLVDQSGLAERIPLVGQYTDLNQKISGEINPLLGPISQITGSGMPQEKEAQRYLEAMQVSATTNPTVAKENAKALRRLLVNSYNAKVKSVVPGAKTTSPEAAEYNRLIEKAKAAGDKATADELTKELEAL